MFHAVIMSSSQNDHGRGHPYPAASSMTILRLTMSLSSGSLIRLTMMIFATRQERKLQSSRYKCQNESVHEVVGDDSNSSPD